MACNTLTSITRGCDNNSGGIFTAYVFPIDDISNFTEDTSTWNVTALDLTTPAVNIEFTRNTSNYTEEGALDLINGSSFVNATINLVLTRREAAKSKAIKIMGEGQRYLGVVVGDANGKYWYFPYAQVSAYGDGSGTAKADGSKYSLTLTAQNDFLAKEVSPAIAASLLV